MEAFQREEDCIDIGLISVEDFVTRYECLRKAPTFTRMFDLQIPVIRIGFGISVRSSVLLLRGQEQSWKVSKMSRMVSFVFAIIDIQWSMAHQ